jgi:micrococcal nuclease
MYTYKAKVVRVIDGDTLDCDIDLGFHIVVRKRVRLDGIDAPEKNSRIAYDRDIAAKATSRAKIALEDKTVILQTKLDKSDKFGRVLGIIFESKKEMIDNQSFNIKLVQEGLASRYDGGKKNV